MTEPCVVKQRGSPPDILVQLRDMGCECARDSIASYRGILGSPSIVGRGFS